MLIILVQVCMLAAAGNILAQDKASEKKAPAIVIDAGPAMVRIGFSGEDKPSAEFPAVVGYASDGSIACIGEEAVKSGTKYKLVYPVSAKGVVDWKGAKALYAGAFKKLGVSPEGHAVMATEQAGESKANRETFMKMLFDEFKAGSCYLSNSSVLSLYASGRTTGVVLTSEGNTVSAVPVYEGYVLQNAVVRTKAVGYQKDARPLLRAIEKCDADIQGDLYGNIILAGTGTLNKNYKVVMQIVANAVVPDKMNAKVIASPERATSVWIGGSILTSLSTFEEMWVTLDEYNKSGAGIVHKKCI